MYRSLTSLFDRYRRRTELTALAELDDRLLADVGLTRGNLTRLRRSGNGVRTHE